MNQHQKIFRIASILLQYPDSEWINDEDLREEISHIEDPQIQELYRAFMAYLESQSIEVLWENYVNTFDFSDKTTLYLTYLVFGDNPERGPAFVKLKEEFYQAGFPLENDELPDYLPLILEFASLAASEHSQKIFLIHKRAIDQLLEGLETSDNPYQWVLRGCVLAVEELLGKRKAS